MKPIPVVSHLNTMAYSIIYIPPRVSYMNFDGSDDYAKDIELHDRLATSGHWSPFEHCAKSQGKGWDVITWSGNFYGFTQYRKMFENENQTDSRVEKKS